MVDKIKVTVTGLVMIHPDKVVYPAFYSLIRIKHVYQESN